MFLVEANIVSSFDYRFRETAVDRRKSSFFLYFARQSVFLKLAINYHFSLHRQLIVIFLISFRQFFFCKHFVRRFLTEDAAGQNSLLCRCFYFFRRFIQATQAFYERRGKIFSMGRLIFFRKLKAGNYDFFKLLFLFRSWSVFALLY